MIKKAIGGIYIISLISLDLSVRNITIAIWNALAVSAMSRNATSSGSVIVKSQIDCLGLRLLL